MEAIVVVGPAEHAANPDAADAVLRRFYDTLYTLEFGYEPLREFQELQRGDCNGEMMLPAWPLQPQQTPGGGGGGRVGGGVPVPKLSTCTTATTPFRIEFSLLVAVEAGGAPEAEGVDSSGEGPRDVGLDMAAGAAGPPPRYLAAAGIELYTCSKVALLSYLITAPTARRRGLARKLMRRVRAEVALLGPEWILVLESLDPDFKDEDEVVKPSIHPLARLSIYHKFELHHIPGFTFVAPAHEPGTKPIHGFMLLFHIGGAVLDTVLPGDRLARFILEYYASCYTDRADWAELVTMLTWCAGHPSIQCASLETVLCLHAFT